jgi:protein-disulfide isomerase
MRSMTRALAILALPLVAACGGESQPLGGGSAQAATAQARQGAGDYAAPRAGRIEAGYQLGAPDAPVVVVEFSDFGCPYCGQFALGTFPDLHREYIEAGLVRWRYIPVSFGFAGGALMGAAAECAGRLEGADGFWRAHEALYRHQTALRGPEALERMLGFLDAVGLNPADINACIREPATAATLEANNRVAEEWFVRGTPSFLVNGAPMSGAMPTDFFRTILDTTLDPSGL